MSSDFVEGMMLAIDDIFHEFACTNCCVTYSLVFVSEESYGE